MNLSEVIDNSSSTSSSLPRAIQIRNTIEVYYPIMLLAFGTVGNLLCLAVLSRKTFRASTIGIYLRFLTLCDLTALYTGVLYFAALGLFSYDIRGASSLSCKFHRWLSYVGCDFSSWALVLVSSARLISIAWPMKRLITPARAYIAITVTIVIICVINLPMFIMVDAPLRNGTRRCSFTSQEYSDFNEYIWSWVVLFKFQFIPALILIILSTAIVFLVSKSYKAVDQVQARTENNSVMNDNFSCSETDLKINSCVKSADKGKTAKFEGCCVCSLASRVLNKAGRCLGCLRRSSRSEDNERRHSAESVASGEHMEQYFCDMRTLVPQGNGTSEEHYTRNGRSSSPDRNSKHWKKYYNTGNMNNLNSRRPTGKISQGNRDKPSEKTNGHCKIGDDMLLAGNTDDGHKDNVPHQVSNILTESKNSQSHSNGNGIATTNMSSDKKNGSHTNSNLNTKTNNINETNPNKDGHVFAISSCATRSLANPSLFKNEAMKSDLKKFNSTGSNEFGSSANEIDNSTYGYVYLGTLPSDKSRAHSNVSETLTEDTNLSHSDTASTQNRTNGKERTSQAHDGSDFDNEQNAGTGCEDSNMIDNDSDFDDDTCDENVEGRNVSSDIGNKNISSRVKEDQTVAMGHCNIAYDSTDENNKEINNLSPSDSDNQNTTPNSTDNNFDEEKTKDSDDDNTNPSIPESSRQPSPSPLNSHNNKTNRRDFQYGSTSTVNTTTETTSPKCTTQCITTHTTGQGTKTTASQFKRRRSNSAQMAAANKGHYKSRSLTRSLLVINTVFMVCNIPIVVYLTGKKYFYPEGNYYPSKALVSLVVNLLMYTNNAVNFILYCVTGSRFREQLKLMFQELFQKVRALLRRS